jgi:EmrB/QacA subfamily drug resistance transporter
VTPVPQNPSRWTLLVAILGSTLAFVDGSVVNVALPILQRDLGATVDQLQWVIEAYALLLSAFVLVGGALGDRLGRRRVFLVGVVLFGAASAACGLAPNAEALIAARAVQGFGAALLTPGSLSLISAAFEKKERGRAIGTWSAASAMTGALGPVIGGWVVGHASWRWIFFINLPIAVAVVALALVKVPESRDEGAPSNMDWMGALLATLSLGLVVYALVSAEHLGGVTSTPVLLLLFGGAVALALFVVVEARVASPMVPLGLFRSRTFAGTNALTLLLYAAIGGALFFLPFVLVQVHHYAPAEAGAALLPLILSISLMSRWTGSLAGRLGPRLLLTVGPLIAAVGFALLALPGARTGGYFASFFPGIAVLGVGMGLTVAPLTTAVMGAVDPHHAGVASGISNAVARTAGLLAVAVLGVVVVSQFGTALDARLATMTLAPETLAALARERGKLAGAALPEGLDASTATHLRAVIDDAFVEGFRAAMWVSSALAALGAVAAFSMIEPRPREQS